jgi:hypothetical protein
LGLKLWHPNARQAAVLSRHRAYLNFIKIEVDIRYKGPFLDSAEEDLMVFGPLKSQSIYQDAICLNSAMIFVKSFVSLCQGLRRSFTVQVASGSRDTCDHSLLPRHQLLLPPNLPSLVRHHVGKNPMDVFLNQTQQD